MPRADAAARMASELLSLNKRRWEQQVRAQSFTAATAATAAAARAAGTAGTGDLRLPSLDGMPQQQRQQPRPAPTGGLIFWRGNPTRMGDGRKEGDALETKGAGMYQPHYFRRDPKHPFWMGHPQFVRVDPDDKNGQGSVAHWRSAEDRRKLWNDTVHHYDAQGAPTAGKDPKYLVRFGEEHFTGLPVNHAYKYRIPNTSVVWKEGDIRCCGIKPTAAQYIWWLNLVCFLAHLAHVFLTLHYAYWRHDMDPTDPKHAERMLVRVYRITGIPTAEMIANNESVGFDPAKRWTNDFYLRDNGMPINFATLTLSFFAISAGFHLWALIAGGFERFWFWYWRQMVRAPPCRKPAGNLPATCRQPAGKPEHPCCARRTTASATGAGSSTPPRRASWPWRSPWPWACASRTSSRASLCCTGAR